MRRAIRQPAGFTLIELLVALVILGTLTGGLGLAFRTGLQANEQARRDMDTAQEVRIILNALRADIEQAALTPGSDRSWFIGSDGKKGEEDADVLQLTTRSHRVPLRDVDPAADWESQARHADWTAVTYSMSAARENAGEGLFRREQIPPGTDPADDQSEEETLSPEVSALNLRYFDGAEWLDAWDSTEQNEGQMPQLVEVSITLRPESDAEAPRTASAVFPVRVRPPAASGAGSTSARVPARPASGGAI